MSPIVDLQRSLRELGRIRTGHQVPDSKGKLRPAKLATFRLTSASRELLEHAAAIYGGTVRAWAEQFELIIEAAALDIVVPPGNSLSQWMEMWSGGGCQRRCDGERETLSDEPCKCPSDPVERRRLAAEGEACKPTTRLNVMLPRVPDLGVWRLEVHGFYAARELAATAELCAMATASGRLMPAQLRLDQRARKRPGQPPQRYAVPVLELPSTTMEELMAARPEVHTVRRPALPEGRPALPADASWHVRNRPAVQGTPPPLPTEPLTSAAPAEAEPMAADEPPDGGGSEPTPLAPAAPPPALTRPTFHAMLRQALISPGQAIAAAQEIFGRTTLTDEERAVVADALGL